MIKIGSDFANGNQACSGTGFWPDDGNIQLCKEIHGGARESQSVGAYELAAGGADS